jgi:hypothetical protein
LTPLHSHRQERPDVEQFNKNQQVAFVMLSEFDYTTEELLEVISVSFEQRYRELFTPSAHE